MKNVEAEGETMPAPIIADDAEYAEIWKQLRTGMLILAVPAYFAALFFYWDETLHWTSFFCRLALLNLAFCGVAFLALKAPIADTLPRLPMRTMVTCLGCMLMPVIASIASKQAIYYEAVAKHFHSRDIVNAIWIGSAFLIGRSPHLLHSTDLKDSVHAKDVESTLVRRNARWFCIGVFIVCSLSDDLTRKIASVHWIGVLADWIAL